MSAKIAPIGSHPKTLSGLFLAAASRIEKRKSLFICEAITSCGTVGYPIHLRTQAKDIVKSRLGNSTFYSGWIRKNHPDLWAQASKELNAAVRLREGRVAWCRALAEEFKDTAS